LFGFKIGGLMEWVFILVFFALCCQSF